MANDAAACVRAFLCRPTLASVRVSTGEGDGGKRKMAKEGKKDASGPSMKAPLNCQL